MELFEMLDRATTFNRRFDRGAAVFSKFFSKMFWVNAVQALLLLVMSPVLLVVFVVGTIAEWFDDRRDGVRTVKE